MKWIDLWFIIYLFDDILFKDFRLNRMMIHVSCKNSFNLYIPLLLLLLLLFNFFHFGSFISSYFLNFSWTFSLFHIFHIIYLLITCHSFSLLSLFIFGFCFTSNINLLVRALQHVREWSRTISHVHEQLEDVEKL